MVDTILTHTMIAERALFYLRNQLSFTRNVYKGYDAEFHGVGGYKKGDSITIHLPNKARTIAGPDITGSIPDTQENSTTVTIDEHRVAPLDFTSQQLTLNVEQFGRKYLEPRTLAMANYVDRQGCAEYVNLYNLVGTAGTTPAAFKILADAAARMDEEAVPEEPRNAVFSSKAGWSMADGELKTVFNQPIVDTMLRRGFRGRFGTFDTFMDQNIQSHTRGTATGSGAALNVKTKPTEGDTSIALQGAGNTLTMTAGDVFTIATVAGVNPISGDAWEGNQVRQFVVTALATSDGGGDITPSVSPAFISSAAGTKILPDQTINDMPEIADVVTIVGNVSAVLPQHIAHHPDCFAMTMVPFEEPDSAGQSVKWATATDPDLGLSLTYAAAFNILTHVEVYRLDGLFGWDTVRPELGVRMTG